MTRPARIEQDVSLAPLTSLELGGAARFFARIAELSQLRECLAWARDAGLEVFILGGGSNVVIGDAPLEALVIQWCPRGQSQVVSGDEVLLRACAGENWDDLVAHTVARDWAGLECLSGIPGWVGATPIQNVGAYGQEVADSIREVTVLDRTSDQVETWPAKRCDFCYRSSTFKRDPSRYVVLDVTFALVAGGAPTLRYAELQRALDAASAQPSSAQPSPAQPPALPLARVRQTVLELRRGKSMVRDATDPNHRSVGSFFTNPILDKRAAQGLFARLREGHGIAAADVPHWPAACGRTKFSAAWLIERAGIHKGLRRGAVGVSSRHTLALVHHGGGSSAQLLALAGEVAAAVKTRFGVELEPEPVMLGCRWPGE